MRRGEVWLANLEPTTGAEISKTRPVIIVSRDRIGRLPLKVIVPITDSKEQYAYRRWMIQLEFLKSVQVEVINHVSTIVELRLRYCTYPLTHQGLKSSGF